MEFDNVKKKGYFAKVSEGQQGLLSFDGANISSTDSNQDIIVVGCSTCNDGYGEITIFSSETGEKLPYTIKGSEEKGKSAGGHIKIQSDPNSSANRIWYTTDKSIIAASLTNYGNSLRLEDMLFVQPVDDVSSNLSLEEGHFIFASYNPETSATGLSTFSSCPSGYKYTYSNINAMKDRECVLCEQGYYSLGWNTECQVCSRLDAVSTDYYYQTNIISNVCYEDNVLIESLKGLGLTGGQIALVILGAMLGVVLLIVALGYYLCKKGKCCAVFERRCSCLIPKKFRKGDKSFESPRRSEKGDEEDGGVPKTADKVEKEIKGERESEL